MHAKPFDGRKILVGVSGGIAAYKAADLVRRLRKKGADVFVIMTQHATELVRPLTFQTVSGNPVAASLFPEVSKKPIRHVSLAENADLFIIAPATANTIAKIANGIADDLLSTTALCVSCPILVAPAMNDKMWRNKIFQSNFSKIKTAGIAVIEPNCGELACGTSGKGRMAEPAEITTAAEDMLMLEKDLRGKNVLVTAGPTLEPIDDVRFVSNRSSGRMGYAIARAAAARGAKTILVSGPVALEQPSGVTLISVETALEMKKAVEANFRKCDIFISAAAVSDYRPSRRVAGKIKKSYSQELVLHLVRNPDILQECGRKKSKKQVVVGFSLETSDLLKNADEKRKRKNADLMVANSAQAIGKDVSRTVFVFAEGKASLPPQPKLATSNILLDRALVILNEKRK